MKKDSILVVALGGGGDSVAAHLIASDLIASGADAYVVSLAWERFVIDPLPGPRRCSELADLISIDDLVGEVTSRTSFPSGARINQSVLVQSWPEIRHFILDPYLGVQGLIVGLKILGSYLGITKMIGVDVGGDVLADHPLPTIRSPLADAMLASSLYCVDPDTKIYVCGAGLDGEIPMEQMHIAISNHLQLNYVIGFYTAPLELVERLISLLRQRLINTEMTGLYLYAHQGMRGNVLVRDAGSIVTVGLDTTVGLIYSARAICEKINPLPIALCETTSIQEASNVVEKHGFLSELTIENDLYEKFSHQYQKSDQQLSTDSILTLLSELVRDNKNINYVAERYISHALKASLSSVRAVLHSMADQLEILPPFVRIK